MTYMEMEEQMARIYSRKFFYEFQAQFMTMVSSIPQLRKVIADKSIYIVLSLKNKHTTAETVAVRSHIAHEASRAWADIEDAIYA